MKVPLSEAAARLRAEGSVLRVGDVIQQWAPGDLSTLTGPQIDGWTWPARHVAIRGYADPGYEVDDRIYEADIPGDFAEAAALEGRLIYPVDPWSTWPAL